VPSYFLGPYDITHRFGKKRVRSRGSEQGFALLVAAYPLRLHGGALWKPLCYSQIGGLGVATFVTLLLVPVLYAIFVLDLKVVKWEGRSELDQERVLRDKQI
jgi:hypothetical protein